VRALFPLLVAGCSFDVNPVHVDFRDLAIPDLQVVDLQQPDLQEPDLQNPDLAPIYCPADPTLLACYRFEDGAHPSLVIDESMYANNAAATNASFPAGRVGTALSVAMNGSVTAGDPVSLAPPGPITLEAWIKLGSLPIGSARYGIVDNEGQYGMFVYANGVLSCSLSVRIPSPDNALGIGAWQHVACTYDRQTVRVYVDGTERANGAATAALGSGTTDGLRLGSNSPSGDIFDGLIDDVRIWSVARTAQDICKDAGC
jgi:hypothetical protein